MSSLCSLLVVVSETLFSNFFFIFSFSFLGAFVSSLHLFALLSADPKLFPPPKGNWNATFGWGSERRSCLRNVPKRIVASPPFTQISLFSVFRIRLFDFLSSIRNGGGNANSAESTTSNKVERKCGNSDAANPETFHNLKRKETGVKKIPRANGNVVRCVNSRLDLRVS